MSGIELFISLFSGRKDCYGINQTCLKEQLTPQIYQGHIDGIKRIGVYPIFDNKFTKWIAADIDIDDFNLALSIKQQAEKYNININIERSKSKGYHCFCFFNEQIEAVKPRLVFEMILKELDIKCEVFPKQDEVLENQFGNFIFIPLFGGDTKNGRTVFVDDSNNIIISNINELGKIKFTDIKNILEVISVNDLKRDNAIIREPHEEDSKTVSGRGLPCIEKIKKGVGKGHRDEAGFRLAISLKEKKVPRDDIEVLLNNWNFKNEPPLTKKELVKIIDSVFKGNYKSYGCDNGIISFYCDKAACPIMQAKDKKQMIEQGIITMVFRDAEVIVFRKKNYEYRLASFEFTKSGKFKCSLTLSKESKIIYKDVINLDTAANRARFVKAAEDKEIDNDLIKIEELVKKQMEKEEHEKLLAPKQLYIMTEQEKNEAIKFLEDSPNILYKVIDTTNRMGVVGEEILRLMVYLCFTSRITKEPLSITVKGESSSGKSFSCQNVQKLIPEEGFHFITRATANAFFHLAEDGMQHRIIYINEIQGSETADYSIRTAQSEGDLILMMPIKDPQTGDMETITKKVKGPVGFLITTTKASMFDENETRNFSVFSDDSSVLTKSIGSITIRKAKGEDFRIEEKELNLWKNVQRLLNPDFKVIIPYAKEVFESFPDKPVRIRRDRERFRVLIEIITILHQYHRAQEQLKEHKGPVKLISTLADYHLAKAIAGAILTYTIYEIGPSAEEVWKAVNVMNDNFTLTEPNNPEFIFKHKDVADYLEWKVDKVKKWMYVLTHAGMIEYAEKGQGGKGKASLFKISKHGRDWSKESLGFLPDIKTLIEKYPCDEKLFYDPITGSQRIVENLDAPEGLLE